MAEKKQEIKTIFSVVADQASKNLKELRKNFKTTEATLKDFSENATSLGAMTFAPLAGVMASLGATVASSLSSFVEYSTGVGDLAAKIGASAQDLQKFQYAALMSGSSGEELAGAVEILGKNLGQVASGKNKAIPEMFKQLGVSLYDANGHLKTATELLPEIANCMRSQETATQKSYIATTLFGKSGQGLIQMLEQGSEGLNELANDAEHLGIVLEDDVLNVAGEYDDAMNRLQTSLQGVQFAIAQKVLPVLTPLVESLTECIAANREWIATSIADIAKDVANALKQIDFKACITGAIDFAKKSYELFDSLGGLKTVAIAVGAVFALNFATSLISTISSIAGVAKALWGLNAALLANPVILIAAAIVAAIAGLIYAGYELYENWDEVCAWVKDIWQGLLDWFSPKIDAFVAVWDRMKELPSVVSEEFSVLADDMKALWEDIKASFFAPFAKAYDSLLDGFSNIKTFGTGIWDSVTGFFSSDANKVTPTPLSADTLAMASGGKMEGTMDIKIHTDEGATAEVVRNNTSNNLKTKVDTGNMRGSYVPV